MLNAVPKFIRLFYLFTSVSFYLYTENAKKIDEYNREESFATHLFGLRFRKSEISTSDWREKGIEIRMKKVGKYI